MKKKGEGESIPVQENYVVKFSDMHEGDVVWRTSYIW